MKTTLAYFIGVQEGRGHLPAIRLWTITEQIGVHPAGSTVSENTLRRHGYEPVQEPVETTAEKLLSFFGLLNATMGVRHG